MKKRIVAPPHVDPTRWHVLIIRLSNHYVPRAIFLVAPRRMGRTSDR